MQIAESSLKANAQVLLNTALYLVYSTAENYTSVWPTSTHLQEVGLLPNTDMQPFLNLP